MRRSILLLAAILACAAAEDRQPPPPPTPAVAAARGALAQALIAELAAEDPLRRAWAVHEIGALGLSEAREPLLALLAGRTDAIHDPERVCALTLDALARLPGTMPPSVVPHALTVARSEVPTLILMARDPVGMRQQLEYLLSWDWRDDATWLAIRELLLPLRSPSLAEELARNLVLHVAVTVRDPGVPEPAAETSGSRTVEAKAIVVRHGIPPIVVYRLALAPEPGAVVLVDGFRTIYWTRREYAVGGPDSWTEPAFDRDEARVDLLMRLRSPPSGDAPPAATRLALAWTTADDYRDRLAALRDGLIAQRRALFAELARQGLLTADADARFPAAIAVVIHDERSRRVAPLPVVAFPSPPPPPMKF